jgi:hypothetical protein
MPKYNKKQSAPSLTRQKGYCCYHAAGKQKHRPPERERVLRNPKFLFKELRKC